MPPEPTQILLTPDEAIRAIAGDFEQYGPQPEQVIAIGSILEKYGISRQPKSPDITDLCALLDPVKYTGHIMTAICERVFQTEATACHDRKGRLTGIWIKNEMHGFSCAQCGMCCRDLAMENECSADDYTRWKEMGRKDILERVMMIPLMDGRIEYRIWVDPGTDRIHSSCPWLDPPDADGKTRCLIQDVKPSICRDYPYTRKHARMTGCPGQFEALPHSR